MRTSISMRGKESTLVPTAALALLLGLPPAAESQVPHAQVLVACDAQSAVVHTFTGLGCHAVTGEGPSYLKLAPGTRAIVFATLSCSGSDGLPLLEDTSFCGMRYGSGTPLNDNVRSVLLAWTGVALHEIRPRERPDDLCWRDSYGRGVGTIPTDCPGEEKDGLLCYPNCRSGYTGAGPV